MKNLTILAVAALMLVSCGSSSTLVTLDQRYPLMYQEQPVSIVIMPPINQTNHAEAKDYFYTSLYTPLCEKGYYVYSPYLTMELFQQESAYDAELFLESDLSKFREVLGADAAMFTIIKDWRRSNVGGKISVDICYILRSTKTGQTLYSREGNISVDTSINVGGVCWPTQWQLPSIRLQPIRLWQVAVVTPMCCRICLQASTLCCMAKTRRMLPARRS